MSKLTRRQSLMAMGAGMATLSRGTAARDDVLRAATAFDESNVHWNTLEGADHVWYHILNVDRDRKVVDILFKFAANEKVFLHRHHADYSTFIIQGELRLYDDQGELTEIRPTASFVQKDAGGAPHTEGGGDEDCIAWFSNVGTDGVIYEILGPNGETAGTLGFADFEALWNALPQPVQPTLTT